MATCTCCLLFHQLCLLEVILKLRCLLVQSVSSVCCVKDHWARRLQDVHLVDLLQILIPCSEVNYQVTLHLGWKCLLFPVYKESMLIPQVAAPTTSSVSY